MKNWDFNGVWLSKYHYKSSHAPGIFTSEHKVKIIRDKDTLIIESLPNEENSYLIIRLKLDDRIATGTWEEITSPKGAHKREIYFGVIQLILSEDGSMFDGKFLSVDKRMEVKSNFWQINRQ